VKKAINEHVEYNTAELDRSKGVATRKQLCEQVAVNMHTMGTSFVGKVRDVRHIIEAQIGQGVANIVKCKAHENGPTEDW